MLCLLDSQRTGHIVTGERRENYLFWYYRFLLLFQLTSYFTLKYGTIFVRKTMLVTIANEFSGH